jgi:hypothetical protein
MGDLGEASGGKAAVRDGATVAAGWYIGIGEEADEGFCQLVEQKFDEKLSEGSMVLSANDSTKDKASGGVAVPRCYTSEEFKALEEAILKEEEAAKAPSIAASLRRMRAPRPREDSSVGRAAVSSAGSGELKLQEMESDKKGAIGLTKALILTLEKAGAKCAYESKTKLSATWPPVGDELFPNIGKTADLVSSDAFKLDKSLSAKSGCPKSEAVLVEAWLGPLGEELEAELS